MPDPWPSLAAHRTLSESLFGDSGPDRIADWLDGEIARTRDADFAASFADHIDLPGVTAGDYLHRIIDTAHGKLLGGIRFYGRDVSRPFVEIVAHSFADLDRLRDCVTAEWSTFAPAALRLLSLPGELTGPRVLLDKTIHVARCRDMRSPAAQVRLQPFDRVEDAITLIHARYRALTPELARNVSAAAEEDIRLWHADGQLHAIHAHGTLVGVLAVAPDAQSWITGQEISEEVVAAAHRGHGFAAQAQTYWAAHLVVDRHDLLIGSIDRLNVASRRTAESAGRRQVLERTFILLPHFSAI